MATTTTPTAPSPSRGRDHPRHTGRLGATTDPGSVIGSTPEEAPADRRDILEYADTEYDDHGGRQVHAHLVADPHEAGSHTGVDHEGHDEDAVVECPLEARSDAAEAGVDRGDDHHCEVTADAL